MFPAYKFDAPFSIWAENVQIISWQIKIGDADITWKVKQHTKSGYRGFENAFSP